MEKIMKNLSVNELQQKAIWLRKRSEESHDMVEKLKHKYRKRAFILKIISVLFSGVATILLGLQIAGLERWFKDGAFILVSIGTIVTALEPFLNFRALWIINEHSQSLFANLTDDIDYYLAGTEPERLNKESLDEFQRRHRHIWETLNTQWNDQRQGNRFSS
jgi:hypothetical protein